MTLWFFSAACRLCETAQGETKRGAPLSCSLGSGLLSSFRAQRVHPPVGGRELGCVARPSAAHSPSRGAKDERPKDGCTRLESAGICLSSLVCQAQYPT